MNERTFQSLFFVSLPDLRKLCAVTVVLNPGVVDAVLRDVQIKTCRYLLFQYQDIVSSPVPGEQNQILVIMAITFYKSGKVQAAVEKHGAKMEVPQRVTPAMLQMCLSYTLTAKLAPSWNKTGHLLIQGENFLSQKGKQCAVVMDLNVAETQLCISLQVYTVRLPPPELIDFDISTVALNIFESNKDAVILRHLISSNWCYVLPSMKMGQIVSISHLIPPDSPFLLYENFQTHWNNLYGYVLPEDPGEDMIYCSVFFKMIGERLFTYPFSCIRSKPVQFFPRIDLDHVLSAFVSDLKSKLPHLCGFPVKMTSKPCYATKDLTRPHVQDIQCRPANLTAKAVCRVSLTQFPSANRSVSAQESLACTAGYDHKMGPLINQTRTCIFAKLSQPLQDTHISDTLNEATSIENRQPVHLGRDSGLPNYSSVSQGVQGSSVALSHSTDAARFIPIFKSRLLQANLMNTKATNRKKQQIALPSSSLASLKTGPNAPLLHRQAQGMPVRKATLHDVAAKVKTSSRGFRFSSTHGMESSAHQANSVFTNSSAKNTTEAMQRKMNSPLLASCINLQLQTLNMDTGQRKTADMSSHAEQKVCSANMNLPHYLETSCEAESINISAKEIVTPQLVKRREKKHCGEGTTNDAAVIHKLTLNSTACLPNVETNDQETSMPPVEFSMKASGFHSQLKSSLEQFAGEEQMTFQLFAADDCLHHEKFCKLGIELKTAAMKESRKRKQEEEHETKFKKSKTKIAIQDVDIENHAKNNQTVLLTLQICSNL